ncbi:5197_t:CDS:2, partial [Dentiscutata erythropus]
FEFWSQSITLDSDRSSLSTLYDLGFVTTVPLYSSMNAFWNSFHNSLEINKCGIDGCRRVLSIIANDFNYEVIKKNLDVSNDLIRAVQKHACIYGPGELVTNKPVIKHEKMTSVADLNPIWDRGSGNNTLPGNFNWFEWQWLTTGEFSGCIKARDIPSIAELDKFRKKDIHKPTPKVSTHTIPSSEWEMLMPNSS